MYVLQLVKKLTSHDMIQAICMRGAYKWALPLVYTDLKSNVAVAGLKNQIMSIGGTEMVCIFGHKWNSCKCTRCGKTRDEQHDWDLCKGQCKRCGKKCLPKHEWNYCTCSICGEKSEHHPHNWQSIGNCMEQCAVCGVNREQHKKEYCSCTVCGKVVSDYDHQWKRVEGSCEDKCTICGKTREQHDWNGLCACRRCGKLNKEKGFSRKEHDWKLLDGRCIEECAFCKETRESHDWNHCTCRVCGKVRDEHDWNRCTCRVCGQVQRIGHDWHRIPNTCTQKCSVCGEIAEVSLVQHDYQRIPGTCAGKCTICGKVYKVMHTLHEWNGCVCRICGETKHDFVPYGPEHIIDNRGGTLQDYKCRRCGKLKEFYGSKGDNW